MKQAKFLALLLLLPMIFCSCRNTGRSEPEQVCLVSAIGFDGEEDGRLRLSVEVPLTRESEAEGMETKLFEGTGKNVPDAMRQITAGLAKELLFSHCALMVLGEGLTREQIQAAFDFASTGEFLPLAAQVVAAPDAGELLRGGSLSTPAAGYDIPGILKQESRILGLDIRCGIYELRANASSYAPTVLPYFIPAGEESAQSALFCGLRLLRDGQDALTIPPEESVFYAMLSGLYAGGSGAPGSLAGAELNRVRSVLSTEKNANGLHFTLTLQMNSVGRRDAEELAELQRQIEEGTKSLFEAMRNEIGADVFFFADRIAEKEPEKWAELSADYAVWFATSDLTVICKISGKESGSI